MTESSFQNLLQQAANGSNEAITILVENHSDAICRVIRRRLHQQMRSQFDTMDFAQIMWASVLGNLERLAGFRTPREFEAFLLRIAENKVVDACRRRMILQKNNVNRELRLDHGTGRPMVDIPAGEPTPSHTVRAREEWEMLLKSLPKRYREMIVLRSEGHSFVAIADKLGVNERTVRRVFTNLGKRLSE